MHSASRRWALALLPIAVACGRGAAPAAKTANAADTLLLPAPAESSLRDDPVSRSGRVIRLEERINDCIRRSLNGRALAVAGDDMRDLVSYISWLSRGTVSGARLRGTGIDSLVPLVADTARGRLAYGQHCARCHGPEGEGMLRRGLLNAGPPLRGVRSFNIGSGMARVRVMAAFVHRHMPIEMPGTASAQTAFDVAAYIGMRPRPDFSGKELDWPNGDAPEDGAYLTKGKVR